ncbi:MAG: hypothetical protein KKD86_14400, partial [Bacteroidetes bacterium]|nr:hypothetical protein [Bacteroidota bacterium]
MEILTIFETHDQGLYSIRFAYENLDEFDRLFELWQDIEYLEDFFDTNKKDLYSGFFGSISIEEAVLRTREDTKELQKQLVEVKNVDNSKTKSLDSFFSPLDNTEYRTVSLQKSKAYGVFDKSWIRLYALKLESNRNYSARM